MSLEKLGWNTYFQKKFEPYLDKEIGCAVKEAIENGRLSIERFNSYKNQLKELKTLKDNSKSHYNNRINKFKKRG